EDRQERRLPRIAAELERDREGRAELGIQREGRVEALAEQLLDQPVTGAAVDRPPAAMPTGALGAGAAMQREGRHAAHDEIVAMGVRDHDDEVRVERPKLVAYLAHCGIDPGDLRFVL